MAVQSNRSITISFAGDIVYSQTFASTQNNSATGVDELKSLPTGFNTITAPAMVGYTVRAVTIIPPVGNTNTITLKGITGDTGVLLSPTEPSSFEIGVGGTFGLTVGSTINGIRFIWT